MAESSDSPEVQAFMAGFQKLRNLVDNAPELIVSEARESNSLRSICIALFDVAYELRSMERGRRELYTSPTNPAFLAAWRDFNSNYSGPVNQVALMGLPHLKDFFGGDPPLSVNSLYVDYSALPELVEELFPPEQPAESDRLELQDAIERQDWAKFEVIVNRLREPYWAKLDMLRDGLRASCAVSKVPAEIEAGPAAKDSRTEAVLRSIRSRGVAPNAPNWKEADAAAQATVHSIEFVFNLGKAFFEKNNYAASDEMTKLKFDAMNGIAAWNPLLDEIGFDLAAVFRRRELTPFVLIPRHVSKRHGAAEPLSLLRLLQQAQEALIYGVPFASIALMRAILERLLKEHYGAIGADLSELIKTAKLPQTVPPARLHRLRMRANSRNCPSRRKGQAI